MEREKYGQNILEAKRSELTLLDIQTYDKAIAFKSVIFASRIENIPTKESQEIDPPMYSNTI